MLLPANALAPNVVNAFGTNNSKSLTATLSSFSYVSPKWLQLANAESPIVLIVLNWASASVLIGYKKFREPANALAPIVTILVKNRLSVVSTAFVNLTRLSQSANALAAIVSNDSLYSLNKIKEFDKQLLYKKRKQFFDDIMEELKND